MGIKKIVNQVLKDEQELSRQDEAIYHKARFVQGNVSILLRLT